MTVLSKFSRTVVKLELTEKVLTVRIQDNDVVQPVVSTVLV
jgi:hypothetical protein